MSDLPFGAVPPAEAHAKGLGPVGYIDPGDPMHAQVEHWFTYQTPTPEQVRMMALLRNAARELAHAIVRACPPSADRTAAIRHLRDAVMTANASIVLGGK